MKGKAVLMVIGAAVVVLIALFLRPQSTSTSGTNRQSAIRFPVEVIPVTAQPVEYQVNAVGSVEAFEVVQVTSRVSGVVERVQFTEGKSVAVGQVLAEIEPERYRIAVASARATFAKAEAAQAEAQAGLNRRAEVDKQNPGLIPGEELEGWRTRAQSAAAEVEQARTAVSLAELNLRDAFVRAPVAGIIQTRTIQTGQYVQPGAVLATMVRRDPLLLRFGVPEHEAGRLSTDLQTFFTVGENKKEYTAQIVHVSERADPASRMVSVTAEIDDPQRENLRPGAFAQVRVPVGGAKNTPVIPELAVRPSERGFLVFIIEDSTAQERVIKLGMRTASGWVEVRNGLKTGESLVVRGADAISDGSPVLPLQYKKE